MKNETEYSENIDPKIFTSTSTKENPFSPTSKSYIEVEFLKSIGEYNQ